MRTKKKRSKLQQVHSQANYAIYFRLHKFFLHEIDKLVVSNDTKVYLELYNNAVDDLKLAIKLDTNKTKQLIRERNMKKVDNKTNQ